jgi:hypothetical protein
MLELLKNWPKGEPVPAISLRQPWPTAVLFYGKDVENRSNWPFKYRGPLIIHASKSKPYAAQIEWMVEAAKTDGIAAEDLEMFANGSYPLALPFGKIVAVVNLAEVFRPEDEVPEEHPLSESPWTGEESDYWLYLKDVTGVKTVSFKGAVGMFKVPYEIAALLEETRGGEGYFEVQEERK